MQNLLLVTLKRKSKSSWIFLKQERLCVLTYISHTKLIDGQVTAIKIKEIQAFIQYLY